MQAGQQGASQKSRRPVTQIVIRVYPCVSMDLLLEPFIERVFVLQT